MDIKLGLSILNKPWLVEHSAALQMLDFWEGVKSGSVQWNYREATGKKDDQTTYNVAQALFAKDDISIAPQSTDEMQDFKGFDNSSIAIIPISGPLMKSDYCGSLGTSSLRQLTQMAVKSPAVKTIIFIIDSPGGTVDGTQAFAEAIKSAGKPTIAYIDGMMCSAAYWIGSCCDKIYAGSNTDIIGSIGTMCSLTDNSEAMKARGVVLREYYATASTDKNKIFTDAKNGDGKALIAEILDPMNDMFMSTVKGNRKAISADALTGKTFLSKKALSVGLIDEIQSFEAVISSIAYSYSPQTIKQKTKTKIMTLSDIKSDTTLWAEVKTEVLADEKDRIESFAAWAEVDPKGVLEAIVKGDKYTQSFGAKMQVKAMSKEGLANIVAASTGAIATTETAIAQTDEQKAEAAAQKTFDNAGKEVLARFGVTATA